MKRTPAFVFTSRRQIICTSGQAVWSEFAQSFFVNGKRWDADEKRWREDVNTGWHLGEVILEAQSPTNADGSPK